MKIRRPIIDSVRGLRLAALMVLLQCLSGAPALAAVGISIDPLCAYGTADCNVAGTVTGVDVSKYRVAPYIKVDDLWWTKPTAAVPTCPIAGSGRYSCDITTGGADLYATAVKVFLMPTATAPGPCLPCQAAPAGTGSVATATRNRPYPRAIAFSGYSWRVKKAAAPYRLGPGPNHFSDAANDVWVDERGLHLRTRQIAGDWYSTEVILQQSLGYGTYVFHTNSRIDALDPNAVLGLFTWDSEAAHPTHREMDIEVSQWGDPTNASNAQFIVQNTSNVCGIGNCVRFPLTVPAADRHMTFYIVWSPGRVEYRAYRGQYWGTPTASALVRKWVYTGTSPAVPVPGKETIRFNLWLFNGAPPINGLGNEVIIENFLFRPPCAAVLTAVLQASAADDGLQTESGGCAASGDAVE
jgi:hypothetical protein